MNFCSLVFVVMDGDTDPIRLAAPEIKPRKHFGAFFVYVDFYKAGIYLEMITIYTKIILCSYSCWHITVVEKKRGAEL